jgi:hypothetical protein
MPGSEWSKAGFKSRYSIQQSYKPRIDKWLDKEIKKTTETIIGVITRLKGDGVDRYFTILDENNRPMEVHYKKEEDHDVVGLYKRLVKVRGVIRTIKTKRSIQSIQDLVPMDTITISNIEYEPLKIAIDFDIEFHDEADLFVAVNEDVGIKVSSESINEIKEKLVSMLDFMVDYYIIQGQGDPSDALKESIENLKLLVDTSRRTTTEKWTEN